MQVQAITVEAYTAIFNELTHARQLHPTPALMTISGMHHKLGQIVLTSDPTHCMLIREKVTKSLDVSASWF